MIVRSCVILPCHHHSLARCLLACLMLAGSALPAAAIPSPEIVVGALSGIGQLGALLMALLGGGAAMALRRNGRGSAVDQARLMRQRRWTIGFAVLAVSFAMLSGWQWMASSAERQAHLEATLARPTRLPGQPRLDPTLKELNFAQQSQHPLGLSTADAERWIAESVAGKRALEILDIREPAEVEMGSFKGARAVRFPDIARIRSEIRAKSLLLICHNGNRSSETCQALAAEGIDCRFIAGGLEKWIVEGRTAGGFRRRSLNEVRAIPDYPNSQRLLDTSEVKSAVGDRNAQFIDLRYPGEFAAGHLPGAINLPMRRMTSADVAQAIAALPDRPVIVPCYERRSCFFGEVLGLELTRAGRPFLGRYTVPWEYFTPSKPPPHVAAALAEARRGWWDKGADRLADLLAYVASLIGLPLAIALMAATSRLIVLPFSLKAERDQIVASRIAGEVTDLKQRLQSDPQRLSRALRDLYRTHGLTPLRNQLALLLLPILALCVAASGRAAEQVSTAWLWIDDLARPDPYFTLPLIFAALFTLYIHCTIATTRTQRTVAWLAGLPGFTALGFALPSASAVYLVTSALLLLLQRALVVGVPGSVAKWVVEQAKRLRPLPTGVIELAEARSRADLGNKARRLGAMAVAGLPVPHGVVLERSFLDAWRVAEPRKRRKLCRRIARVVGGPLLAVRSSAASEDGAEQSFAGIYDSVVGVRPRDLAAAIDRVLASFGSTRSEAYGGEHAGDANIIVQCMIEGQYAGVLFTRAPDAAGQMMIELVAGTGDALVSGHVTPHRFCLGRASLTFMEDATPPIDLLPLARMARQIEAQFEGPQDIEWAWRDGCFHIVQSRDITAIADAPTPDVGQHWRDVIDTVGRSGAAVQLVRNELSELLPRPTLLSLSMMERLYSSGGSVDLACRALGLAYPVGEHAPSAFVSVLGRLYVNAEETRRRAPRLSPAAIRRIARATNTIEANFRDHVAPRIKEDMTLLGAVTLDNLGTEALMRHARKLVDDYTTQTHLEAEIVNIAADMAERELTRLAERAGVDRSALAGAEGSTILAREIEAAETMSSHDAAAHLSAMFGHRALYDYELSAPRFCDDASSLDAFVLQHRKAPSHSHQSGIAAPSRKLALAAERAGRMQILKEDAKHIVLMAFAEIRRILLAIDRRFDLGGRIFHLTLDEALRLDVGSRDGLLELAKRRQEDHKAYSSLPPLPGKLTLVELEKATRGNGIGPRDGEAGQRGTRVAGRRVAEGRALLIPPEAVEAGQPPPGFRDGDIIFTPMLHPGWLPFLLRAGGVVSEVGGWLSHMAIVARERDVAMIVGIGAPAGIATGDRVRLHLDGRVEVLDETAGQGEQRIAAE